MKRFEEIRSEYKQRCICVSVYEKMSRLNSEQKEKLRDKKAVIEKTEAVLDSLPGTEKEILQRYINGSDRWYQKAAIELNMSQTTIYRLLRKAVENAQRLYDSL